MKEYVEIFGRDENGPQLTVDYQQMENKGTAITFSGESIHLTDILLFDKLIRFLLRSLDIGLGLGYLVGVSMVERTFSIGLLYFCSRTEIIYTMKQIYKMPRNN